MVDKYFPYLIIWSIFILCVVIIFLIERLTANDKTILQDYSDDEDFDTTNENILIPDMETKPIFLDRLDVLTKTLPKPQIPIWQPESSKDTIWKAITVPANKDGYRFTTKEDYWGEQK